MKPEPHAGANARKDGDATSAKNSGGRSRPARYRVACPACEYVHNRMYPSAVVADLTAERHDRRVHHGEATAVIERVRIIAGGRR